MTTAKSKQLAGTVKSVDSGDSEGPGEFIAVLSTDRLDRDREIVAKDAFAATLPEHINIDVDHGFTVESIVGSGEPSYEEGKLMIRGKYASTARGQEVRTLVNEGHLKTLSVFFNNAKGRMAPDGETFIIEQADLLNAGFVSIPANPDAVVVSSKSSSANDDPVDPDDVDSDPLEASKSSVELASAQHKLNQMRLKMALTELD